jgi:hypothetical protein
MGRILSKTLVINSSSMWVSTKYKLSKLFPENSPKFYPKRILVRLEPILL